MLFCRKVIVWCSSLNNSNSKTAIFFSLGVRELSLLSMMIALCVVSRTFFQFIVNVQPVTAILLIITIYWGSYQGLLVSIFSILITNFYMGMGVWTIAQIITYSLIIFLTGVLKMSPTFKNSLLLQAIYAGISGILFGFFISAIHGFGNIVFYLLLAPILRRLLTQHLRKWQKDSSK